MRYVPKTQETHARKIVDFDSCGNISRTGSVLGMQKQFGWKPLGQVRMGNYIYNVGPDAVKKLQDAHLLKE